MANSQGTGSFASVDVEKLCLLMDAAVAGYERQGYRVVTIVLPGSYEGPFYTRLINTPLPADSQMRMDRGPKGKGIYVYVRNIRAVFTPKLAKGCLFRIERINP